MIWWQGEIDEALFMQWLLALWGELYPDVVIGRGGTDWVSDVFIAVASEFRDDHLELFMGKRRRARSVNATDDQIFHIDIHGLHVLLELGFRL